MLIVLSSAKVERWNDCRGKLVNSGGLVATPQEFLNFVCLYPNYPVQRSRTVHAYSPRTDSNLPLGSTELSMSY